MTTSGSTTTKDTPVILSSVVIQAADLFLKFVFLILTTFIGMIAYQGSSLIRVSADHEKRLTGIEASRYTSADAIKDQREMGRLTQSMTELTSDVGDVRTDIKEMRSEIREFYKSHASPTRPPSPVAEDH